jgi:hypothetical protein
MISVKGDMKAVSNQLQTTNGGGLSKGSAVLSGSMYKKMVHMLVIIHQLMIHTVEVGQH